MIGKELKERRNKLKIARQHFGNLLGVKTDELYRWEIGKTAIPLNIEQVVAAIEERLNKSRNGKF